LLYALTKVMLKQTEHSDDEVQNKTEQSALTEIRLKELALEDQRMKIEADMRKPEMELRKTELELELKM